jgi:hypothetical protein
LRATPPPARSSAVPPAPPAAAWGPVPTTDAVDGRLARRPTTRFACRRGLAPRRLSFARLPAPPRGRDHDHTQGTHRCSPRS